MRKSTSTHWEEKHGDGKSDFQRECNAVAQNVSAKGSNSFLVCVDGSEQSDYAFKAILNMRRKFDHVTVFHATNEKKAADYPAQWKPKFLRAKFEVELIGHLPASLQALCFVERNGASVTEILADALDEKKKEPVLPHMPDWVIMGHHGRKGPKEEATMLGTNTDLALRFLRYPCIVVKSAILAGPRNYVMAVNGSDVSKRGLDVLLRLINPRDSLTLVNFVTAAVPDPNADAMKAYYEEELEVVGPAGSKFVTVEYAAQPLTHAVLAYLNDSDADLFAIAPRAQKNNSSITDYILNRCLISVVLCKN